MNNTNIRNKKTLSLIIASVLIGSILGAILTSAASPSVIFTISTGKYPGAPSFTIWEETGIYYSKDYSGAISYYGENASQVISLSLANGKAVYLTNGNYSIDSPIQVVSGNLLYGETSASGFTDGGLGSVLVLADNAQCNVIERSKVTSYNNIAIKNLLIDGNKANNPDNSVDGDMCGIYLGSVQGWLIENVKVVDTQREAIYIASSSYGKMISVTTGRSNRGGIILDAGVYNDLVNVVTYENDATDGSLGCGIEISTNVNMRFDVSVTGGRSFGNHFGIAVRNYGTNTYSECVSISGFSAFENLYDGFWLKQASSVSISDSNSYYNNRSGFLIDDSYNSSIVGCHSYDNDYANTESTYGNGISVQDSLFCIISASFFGNRYGTTQNRGFEEFGTADYNIMLGCALIKNTTPYTILGTHTHVNCTWNGYTWKE